MKRSTLTQFKKTVALVPGAVTVKRALFARGGSVSIPITRPSGRGKAPSVDEDALRQAYERSPLGTERDSFVLYRIVGNDLVPRHRKGQSRENLAFILQNEPDFPDCEKRFVLNRIVDRDEEHAIVEMLLAAGKPFLRLPFDRGAYHRVPWDIEGVPERYAPFGGNFANMREDHRGRVHMRLFRLKNNAVMNNNGARNAALTDGRHRGKWILPFDGNCFFTREAWGELAEGVKARPHYPYHLVPMARIVDNGDLLRPDFAPPAQEEPQMLFRRDAAEMFDERVPYGRRPKVELFWRLGVPGLWDDWPIEPWDLGAPAYAPDAGKVSSSGWVARLFSGQRHLEIADGSNSLVGRGLARVDAIEALLLDLDRRGDLGGKMSVLSGAERPDVGSPAPGAATLPETLLTQLTDLAGSALERGPFSVTRKTTLPPSGDPHDYWHPAPYYWPHPLRIPGLPYVQRDGVRVPGTLLYEPASDQFDRTRLQRLFDDTFILSLTFRETGKTAFAEHAARNVRTWFLNAETAMNPSLDYAQVRRGHNNNRGNSSGIIEMKDLYFFLDAVRILQAAGALDGAEIARFGDWLRAYRTWLQLAPQAVVERSAANNHGTYYDLQIGSIALFLEEETLLRTTLRDSRSRIISQFRADGSQPEELRRTTTAHYCAFNLQGWVHLADLAAAVGEDLWDFEGPGGQSIQRAIRWLSAYIGAEWPFQQIDPFDEERLFPLFHAFEARTGAPPCQARVPAPDRIKPIFHPHDGIRPFWQIR